jgi:hypothetical protein
MSNININNYRNSIVAVVLVIGGLAIVPALNGHEIQTTLPKDIKTKVTDFLKKLKDRLNRGSGYVGGEGNG